MTHDSRTGRALTALVDASHRRPWTLIAALAALFAVALTIARTLPLRGDFVELLPADAEEVRDMRLVEAKAGGDGYLVVQVKGGTRGERRAFADALAPRLRAETELVRYVDHRFDVTFFEDRALLLLTEAELRSLRDDVVARIEYERAKHDPFDLGLDPEGEGKPEPPDFDAIEKKHTREAPISEYLESKDATELYLYVKPAQSASDLDFDRRIVARVRALAAEVGAGRAGVEVALTGAYVILPEENAVMQGDVVRAGVLAAVLALSILLLASRRPVVLAIVGAPVALGIAATFAFAKVVVGHLNPVTGFLGAILIGLGVEYGVHLSMRYREERGRHEPVEAMRRAVLGTFSGALTSAATNAAAFATLIFAELEAFRQFGKIAAFGVMSTLAGTYLLGPALLFAADGIRPFSRRTPAADPPATAPDPGPRRPQRPIPRAALLAVVVGMAGFAVWSLSMYSKVGFATDLKALKGESPATALDDHITAQLGIVWRPSVLYVRTIEDARAATRIALAVKSEAGARTAIDRVVSLDDFLPHDAGPKLALMKDIRAAIEGAPGTPEARGERVKRVLRMTEAAPWSASDLPPEVKRRFLPLSGEGTFVLIFPRHAGYDTRELESQAADLDEITRRAQAAGIEAHLLDGNRIAARIMALIRSDGPRVLGLASVVVLAMIALSLRSLRRAILCAAPLYVGLACLIGAMYLAGVELNFLNVVVLPNLLTIAVDNSVHIFHRYREEGPGSLRRVLAGTGFAALVATASNAAGYAAMLVARHAGLRSVGVLAVLGVACTFAGTTVLFPAVLALLERRKKEPAALGVTADP